MVGWANCDGVRVAISQEQGIMNKTSEQEAARKEDQNSSSSGPIVDVDVNVDASFDSSDIDGDFRGEAVTPAGEEDQSKDKDGLVPGDLHVIAGIVHEELRAGELQLQPHRSSLSIPSPHAVASSTATPPGPRGHDPLESCADAKNGNKKTEDRAKSCGGHPATLSINAPLGRGMPADARDVAEEQIIAHGTGTKAVRSLSRGVGGGRGGGTTEMEGGAHAIFESEALLRTHFANSCGEPTSRTRRNGPGWSCLLISPLSQRLCSLPGI